MERAESGASGASEGAIPARTVTTNFIDGGWFRSWWWRVITEKQRFSSLMRRRVLLMMGVAGDALDQVAKAPAASRVIGATLTHGPRGGDWVRREWLGCAAEGECIFLPQKGKLLSWMESLERFLETGTTLLL
ncbi:hypothetical protein V8G54_004308 [Vigna mungo]|uniref:Uncharacterized protein n=1 Tax=Vigna mungo TaxID=3915 RepID=A0AAQ3SB00_VIGMU